jgi:hypothetical protein
MKSQLHNPANRAASFIDFQLQILFGVADIDRQTLFNKFLLISKLSKIFMVPTMLTAVEIKDFFSIITLQNPSSFQEKSHETIFEPHQKPRNLA